RQLRASAPANKKLIYTFWITDSTLKAPLSSLPNAAQIAAITRVAMQLGVRHVDYYGFRIGDWRVSAKEWEEYRSEARDYPVVPSLRGCFLCDRPAMRQQLKGQIEKL